MKRQVVVALPAAAMLCLSAWSGYAMLVLMAWQLIGLIAFKVAGRRMRVSDVHGLGAHWRFGWRRMILIQHFLWYWPLYLFILRRA